MSDTKPPSGESAPDAGDAGRPDRPPRDHVAPDEPSPQDRPPRDHAARDEPSPQDRQPRDHVTPDEPSPWDRPPRDHVAPDEASPQDRPPRDHAARDEPSPQDRQPRDHVAPDEPSPQSHAAPGEPPPQTNRLVEHLTSRTAWLRVLFMVLFVALWTISRLVVMAVMVLQVLILLFSGKRDARLAGFGAALAAYTYQLVAYLTFATEKQPFPFSDWPTDSRLSEAGDTEPADTA